MKDYSCIVCHQKQIKIFSYKGYNYYRCINCHLVSTYPYPDKKQIISHYKTKFIKGNYSILQDFASSYNSVYQSFADLLIRALNNNNKRINDAKVLDIGCFTGDFLKILQNKGADVYGIELQKEAVDIANKHLGGKVYQADAMSDTFPEKEFDVITMTGLVEHITNPEKLIEKSSRLLKKDGIIFIQTPNSDSFFAHVLIKHWPPYEPIEHIHIFSRKSLEFLLKNNGFSNIYFCQSWKKLPTGYIYNMLQNFGEEFYMILKPFNYLFNTFLSRVRLPFYIGEMILIAKKTI